MQEHRYQAQDETEKRTGYRGLTEESAGSRIRDRPKESKKEQAACSGMVRESRLDQTWKPDRISAGEGKKTGRRMIREGTDFEKPFQRQSDRQPEAEADGLDYGKNRLKGQPGQRLRFWKTGRGQEKDRETEDADRPDGDGRQRKPGQYLEGKDGRKQPEEDEEQETREETEPSCPDVLSERPLREESVRSRPLAAVGYREAAGAGHIRKKKQVQEHARKEREKREAAKKQEAEKKQEAGTEKEEGKYRQTQEVSEKDLEEFRDEIGRKTKRERLNREQSRKAARLSFEDESGCMVCGPGMKPVKSAAFAAAEAALAYAHGKTAEAGSDNAAVDASNRAELMAESALRLALHEQDSQLHERKQRLQEIPGETESRLKILHEAAGETEKSAAGKAAQESRKKENIVKRFWQKQRYKKAYTAAREGRKEAENAVRVSENLIGKAKRVAAEIAARNKGILAAAAVMAVLFAVMAVSLSSCSALMQGTSSSIAGTTYPSTDEDIYAVEDAYRALERSLDAQINAMETSHAGYDEYRYQVDEISHNPYHLISYFTAKYGEFTYDQVKDEIEEIFREQYGLSVSGNKGTVTEKKMVRVGESLGQVTTSGYCSCQICCGKWSGGPTASGHYPVANHTLGVDADDPFVPMGTRVIMNGIEYEVEDTGSLARYGRQFDVYYGSHAEAVAHGIRVWEAYLADDNGTREVEAVTTRQINRLDVSLKNHSLDAVLRKRMDENEEKRYDLYNTTSGHRDYLFDLNALQTGAAGGFGYQIPAEALSDQKFANMIREAEKYLGMAFVFGGSSPSTGFDCSGFVSWVINHCGNGWNVGRPTADSLRGYCAYVPPEQAKPGDLIFFENTYNTPGASHVGIYVGDNVMLHCGDPIKYASIATPYWQEHFLAFGRIQ